MTPLRSRRHVQRSGVPTRRDFYRSMTHADHKTWQDVYHGLVPDGAASHMELTVVDEVTGRYH
jgi:hypothetical protein